MKKALPVMVFALVSVSGCALIPTEKIKQSFNAAKTTLSETLNSDGRYDENGNLIEVREVRHDPVAQPLTKEQKLLRRAGVVLGDPVNEQPATYLTSQ